MKLLPVQLVPISSCHLHVAPSEDRISVLFLATTKYRKTDEMPHEQLLQGEKT